jgi:Ca-activated chloride channel family protein
MKLTMANYETIASLADDYGREVALQSVRADGEITGYFLKMKLRQVYKNTTDKNIEAVYTFPLPWGTTLLGLNFELNGKRLSACVLERKEAEEKYEAAIENGDTPVMVEKFSRDTYSANLGNLLPGEDAVIELEYGQILEMEQGQIRMSLPTTIAPKFGESPTLIGKAANLLAPFNPMVEHRFFLSLKIAKPLLSGSISSPSHAIKTSIHDDYVQVDIAKKAMLDRDFVLLISDVIDQPFAMAGLDPFDGGSYTYLGSFIANLPSVENFDFPHAMPLKLKVLVDCSGSMQGDSMRQAKEALDNLFSHLQTTDLASYSKFGTHAENVLRQLLPCSFVHLEDLRDALDETDADMGGTQMDKAIQAVLKINDAHGNPAESASILLITDGAVWDIQNIVSTVRSSGHQIFALGVGSSPSDSLLRELADVSGGACEIVTPKERMDDAVMRLVERMRFSRPVKVNFETKEAKFWESKKTTLVTSRSVIHQWAKTKEKPKAIPVLTCTDLLSEDSIQTCIPLKLHWDDSGALARVCAAQQLNDLTDEKQIRELAIKYQLVTEYTNLFLVHVRDQHDKADGLPELHQVEGMLAAGWGGFGSVFTGDQTDIRTLRTGDCAAAYSTLRAPSVWRSSRMLSAAPLELRQRSYESFAQILGNSSERDNPLAKLIQLANKEISSERASSWVDVFSNLEFTIDSMLELIDSLADILGSPLLAWAFLLEWVTTSTNFEKKLSRKSLRHIRLLTSKIDDASQAAATEKLATASREKFNDFKTDVGGVDDYEIPAFLRKQAD